MRQDHPSYIDGPTPAVGRSYAIVSSYPPTPCGIATFSAALTGGLRAGGAAVQIVRLGGGGQTGPGTASAEMTLRDADVVIVQHEYGLYDGPDGDTVIDLLDGLERPSIVVAHTVLQQPTPHQRDVLERVAGAADAVVVMTEAGRDRLCGGFDVDPGKVTVIAHGAAVAAAPVDGSGQAEQGALLTWGLLGPGKGIEHAIDALALLRDVLPRPRYLIAGDTHPKVAALDGEAYRDMLVSRAARAGVAAQVEFDPGYRTLRGLADLLQAACVVVLPYDSPDQVTSGVLVDAVAAGRPVVATAFPHAVELLASGAGLVVPQRDPAALAGALRRVLTQPDLAASMSAEARRLAPSLAWPAVARQYVALSDGIVAGTEALSRVIETTPYRHLVTMTDRYGTFEHADHAAPRPEHGYCVDDMARVLLVASREPEPSPASRELARRSLRFLAEAQGPTGRTRNRRSVDGRWHGRRGVEDCWGRSVWALGAAAAASTGFPADSARTYFDHAAQQRSPWPRAMAFAALGAAAVADDDPRAPRARTLLAAAADLLLGLGAHAPTGWTWPEARLSYANAALPDALLAAGRTLGRDELVERGLELLGWLLDRETRDGHLSVTPVGGAGPADRGPRFDQQPIEVATMADACARAAALTGDHRWREGVRMAGAWFDGDNDAGAVMWDPSTGGGFDGLTGDGPNRNQGTESTLALIATRQHVEHLALLAR